MIAHDMRTPLSALTLSLTSVQRATTLEDAQKGVEIAIRNAKALSAIIETLIETSVVGEARLGIHECLPLDLVTAAIDQIEPLAEGKRLRIETGELTALPPITADGVRIIRVLTNLLSNAVRFSPEGGQIVVSAKPRLNDGHPVTVFSVSDEGLGVPADEIERIFIKGVSLGKESTGLGLTVCKEIVEAHGGRIWVETGRSKGATFSFSIPAKEAAR